MTMRIFATSAACLMLLTGCLGDTELGTQQPFCPKTDATIQTAAQLAVEFRPVNNMLERRCGTLDCHGDVARPFIVYGQNGLRRIGDHLNQEDLTAPQQYFTGGLQPTLQYELLGTYQSACGLEPEQMDAVVKGAEPPETLTLIRKPRLEEKHKGGRIWSSGSVNGDKCLVGWVTGALNPESCIKELEAP
jgi:hypothetical protein